MQGAVCRCRLGLQVNAVCLVSARLGLPGTQEDQGLQGGGLTEEWQSRPAGLAFLDAEVMSHKHRGWIRRGDVAGV